MKRTKYFLLSVLLTGIVFQSCTKVEAPYYTTKEVKIDTNLRSVLLEDYTGMKCQNCPQAAVLAKTLETLYEHQVFVIAVHAGYFANPDSLNPASPFYTQDFRNPTSQTWLTTFNIVTNPLGLVNRVRYNASPEMYIQTDEWADAVAAQVKLPKAAVMSMHNSVTITGSDTTLSSSVQLRFLQKFSGTYNLCVCILEDGIVGPQQVGQVVNHEYVFNDLLRGSINGYFGDQVTTANDTVSVIRKDYTKKLSGKWNADNLNVIAFILNADTKQVLHVIKKKAKQ